MERKDSAKGCRGNTRAHAHQRYVWRVGIRVRAAAQPERNVGTFFIKKQKLQAEISIH